MTASYTGTYNEDGLQIGGLEFITEEGTILSGESVVRGEVVGKVTASGKYIPCDHTVSDGSQIPRGIMVMAIDASAADVTGVFYTHGQFDSDKLTFGGTSDIDDLKDALKDANLYTKDLVSPN